MRKIFKFRKKGFTLIELLAVIVVLAIILMIVTPIVLTVISDSRKSAFEASALGILKTAENECLVESLGNIPLARVVNFNEGLMGEEKLGFSGRGPTGGFVQINEQCEVAMAIYRDDWCAIKQYNDALPIIIPYDGNCDLGGSFAGYPILQDSGADSYDFTPLNSVEIHELINNEDYLPIANKTELKQIEGVSGGSPVSLTFGAGTEFEMEHAECYWDEIDEMCYGYYAGGMSLNYILVADIDLEGSFEPIGYDEMGEWAFQTFNGNLNGNGHKIYNGTIDYAGESMIGLFAIISAASQSVFPFGVEERIIENLWLEDITVNGTNAVGMLAGRTVSVSAELGPTIRNVHAQGIVNGHGSGIGGLIGLGDQDGQFLIEYSSTDVTVTNTREVDEPYGSEMIGAIYPGGWTGGLAGRSSHVKNSHAIGDVSGDVIVGGLVGVAYGDVENSYATGNVFGIGHEDTVLGGLVGMSGSISQSYATGNVSGINILGGLVGTNYFPVLNSYANGEVTGQEKIGGLVGESFAEINHSYAIGLVTGSSQVGGLIGNLESIVTNAYYNTETTNQTDNDGRGQPRNTEQMQYPHDETTYIDWDLENIWTWQE